MNTTGATVSKDIDIIEQSILCYEKYKTRQDQRKNRLIDRHSLKGFHSAFMEVILG